MKLIRIICILFIMNINSISKNEILKQFLDADLIYFANKIIELQIKMDALDGLHNFMLRDSIVIEDRQTLINLYSFLDPSYEEKLDSGYVLLPKIKCQRLFDNLYSYKFRLFIGYNQFEFHPSTYIISLGFDGKFYFLKNFDKEDFNLLVRNYYGEINNILIAEEVAKLYIRTVKNEYLFEDELIIIDNRTINNFKEKYKNIELPKVVDKKNHFIIIIFAVIETEDAILRYEIKLSKLGNILKFNKKYIEGI